MITDEDDEKFWCKFCQIWVAKTELKTFVNDADVTEYWCPGCDCELDREHLQKADRNV